MKHDARLIHRSSLMTAMLGIVCAHLFGPGFELAAAPGAGAGVAGLAAGFVSTSDLPGGICGIVGAEDGDLALAIAARGQFVVHCLSRERSTVARLRQDLRAGGVYGTVSADLLAGSRLPYAENLVNLLIVRRFSPRGGAGPGAAEIARVLTPLGTAFVGTTLNGAAARAWAAEVNAAIRTAGLEPIEAPDAGGTWLGMRKPWPPDIDEWTHFLHGADGNPVADDRIVGPPKHYQWISGPVWMRSHETDSSISTLVSARGRLFAITDQAPISVAGEHDLPDKWFLVARDAFNGVWLWEMPLRRWGWREWKPSWFNTRPGDVPLNIQKRLVAVGDKVYITPGYRAPVHELDAKTGKILKTYPGTERCGEILYLDGTLILTLLTGDGARVTAIDAETGRQLWLTETVYGGSTVDYVKWTAMPGGTRAPKLDPSLNISADGGVAAFIHGPKIVALDLTTGREKWRTAFPSDPADLNAGGIDSQGNLWIGTMIVSAGVVIHASPNKLAAFSAANGELLWEQSKKYIGHLWYEWKDVFVIDGLVWTWSADLERGSFDIGRKRKQRTLWPRSAKGYDIQTGKLVREVPLGNIFKANHHHRCYRNKATVRYILASRRGTEFVDLINGKHTVDNWIRGTCHVGMMPANGLQYAPPHPCTCYIDEKLNGMNVVAPEIPARYRRKKEESTPALERGSAYGRKPTEEGADSAAEDWPAFRHDSMRSGAVPTQVPADLRPLWRAKVGTKVSPPIVAGGRVFAALQDEHRVVSLNAENGDVEWEFTAGGRMDSPPTYYNGTVIFGSADGWVYCVQATDGALVWRRRPAPENRLIGAFGQLESAWPVSGSVLVQNGIVYSAAGRTSQVDGGIYLVGLDAATGELLHQRNLDGPHYTVENVTENFKLPMGALPDILMGDGSTVYMRSRAFTSALEPTRGAPGLRPRGGFLDDTYFKRAPWTFGQKGAYGRLIVHDDRSAYYVRQFDSLRGLDPTVYFTPGKKGYLLFAKNMSGNQEAWAGRIPVRIRAMLLAADRLFVAGPPDVVDPKDQLGAFEGRKVGRLHVFEATSGKELAAYTLAAPPVFNGCAAARGRFYLADEDGIITCFGGR